MTALDAARVTDEMVEAAALAIEAEVPDGYGMSSTEAEKYARAALTAALTLVPAGTVGAPYMWVKEWPAHFDPQNGGEPASAEFFDKPTPGAFPLYRAALAGSGDMQAGVLPEGYRLVPIKLTPAMEKAWWSSDDIIPDKSVSGRWRSAVLAAPEPPAAVPQPDAAQRLYEFVGKLGVHGPDPKPWAERSQEHKDLWRQAAAIATAIPQQAAEPVAERTVGFVALWAWREGVTDAERLAAIQWHPNIRRAAGLGPLAAPPPSAGLYAAPQPTEPLPPLGWITADEKLCFDRAMDQWEKSLARPDLSEQDRVKGALDAYVRQAFALTIAVAPSPLAPSGLDAATLEAAAQLIERTHIVHSSLGPDGLAPRSKGNLMGLAYAAAIRALATQGVR